MGDSKTRTPRTKAITAKALDGVICNEIRPQLARHSALIEKLRTDYRAHDRRISEIETGFANIEDALVKVKDDIGQSLQIILRNQSKCREDILERIDKLPSDGLEHDR